MARRARERVEAHFSWTSIARQTLGFYQDLIDTHDVRRTNVVI
jgi:glycosyltransferase involved in cell wall biosynthesis